MRHSYLFIFLFFIFISCDSRNINNSNTDSTTINNYNNKSDNNSSNQINDSLLNYVILDKIKEVSTNFLPIPIKKYLKEPKSVQLDLLDYYSAEFQFENNNEYFQANVQYLKPYYGKEIISFCVFKGNNSEFTNYFFFLQKFNEEWTNISELFISDEIIKLLKTELNSNIEYKTIDQISAYYSDKTDKALLFDFSNTSRILVFIKNNWISIGQIDVINNKMIILSNTSNIGRSKLLSPSELDLTKRFTNFNQAIADSSNVYILDLASVGLTELNEDIDKLKRLQILILEDNYLSELPPEICSLDKLQVLRINSNQIKELPIDLGLAKNIEEITASYNKLSYLPISLNQAKKLRVLNLDHNLLTSIIIDFSEMQDLVILNLSSNNLSTLPTSIGNLKNLISLDISNNPIKSLPNQIYDLKNLTYVDLTKTNIPETQIIKLMDLNPEMTIVMD